MTIGVVINIRNMTKEVIKITRSERGAGTSRDDGLKIGSEIYPNETGSVSFGNSSVIPPKGCGYNISFDCDSHGGWVNFETPAVGSHSFDLGNKEFFSFDERETGGHNHYDITISNK